MKKTVSVAPMMDCTDKHEIYFLSLISKNIHLYSEMIVANAIIRGDRDKLLSFKKISNPVTLQVGGSNVSELAEACRITEQYGYKEINLNLGCPSKKVQKNKFGACLMQEPKLVARCIESMAKATKLPITIKTRIGYNDVEDFEFLKSFIQTTKDAGSQKFIIHARKAILKKLTPTENLNIPPLKYDFVYKQIEREVFGNDNIPTRSEVMEKLIPYIQEETAKGVQLNHIMRHTVGLFHGQNGSRVWKQYLSKNMCIRDADLKKVNHLMDQIKKTKTISLER